MVPFKEKSIKVWYSKAQFKIPEGMRYTPHLPSTDQERETLSKPSQRLESTTPTIADPLASQAFIKRLPSLGSIASIGVAASATENLKLPP